MTKPTPLYTMQSSVQDSDTDFRRRQKLSSMFRMFQDIAALHAANLGASVKRLHEELNVAWILMRVRIEIDRYPVLSQELTVETWPQAPRALYDRDYMLRDLENNALVRAASTWVIMDLGTREIKRDKFLDYCGLEMNKERSLGRSLGKLKQVPNAKLAYEKRIQFSDVDYNIHVNNAKYVDFVMDAFSFDEHRKGVIKAFEINYVNEIGPGEVIHIKRKPLGDGIEYVEGMRKIDKALVFNAIAEWEDA